MKNCDICFQIICKNCKWKASAEEIKMIQNGSIKNCPDCGLNPSEELNQTTRIL